MSAPSDQIDNGPLNGEILSGRDLVVMEEREQTVRTKFWGKFRKVVGSIPFARDLLAAYFCAMDSRTPLSVRATLLGALAYFIMPIDALPDFLIVLGYTDDAAILFAAIRAVSSAMLPDHYDQADAALSEDSDSKV